MKAVYADQRQEILAKAIVMSVNAHGTDANKDGTPYITHPIRLMMAAGSPEAKTVAILHDTIEDTPLTLASLRHADFPPEIVEAVDALTKRSGESYQDAILRVAGNKLATEVKLLDLADNIDVTRLPELGDWELQRTFKYHTAIRFLRGDLTEAEFRDAKPAPVSY